MASEPAGPRKDPGVAAALNFVLPGAGYLYARRSFDAVWTFVFAAFAVHGIYGGHDLLPFYGLIAAGSAGMAYFYVYRDNRKRDAAEAASTVVCAFCAERILVAAKVCKHCGRDVQVAA